MGGNRLGSYDLVSSVAAGESTFLARRRPFTSETDRLFAVRLVDAETASWATAQVGRGWFPNLGPVLEVGRDGDSWFVVADVDHSRQIEAVAPADSSVSSGGRRHMVAAAAALAVIIIAGGAWAVNGPLADDHSGADLGAGPQTPGAPAIAATPAVARPATVSPTEPAAPAPDVAAQPEVSTRPAAADAKPERQVSKRILRARERQAAARETRERRAEQAARARATRAPRGAEITAAAKSSSTATRICPRTGRVLPN